MAAVTDASEPLTEAYAAALRTYVADGGEAPLLQAYELGRQAAASGLGILDVMAMHQLALRPLCSPQAVSVPASDLCERASEFLSEAASPFEMTLRAYREAAQALGVSASRTAEHAEIYRAREQLSAILDATTAVIYLKDAEGRYLFANRPCQAALGTSAEALIGRTDAQALSPALAAVLSTHDQRALAAGKPWEVEETLPLPQGRRTFLSLKFPLVDTHGSAYGVCNVATDITDRKRASDALARAKEALEAKNRELESFNYTVAHDLRAPARRIDGFVDVLLEQVEELSPEGQRYVGSIQRSARQMMELIEGLMVLSQVARSEVHRRPVDLAALAREIVSLLGQSEPGRQVSIAIPEHLRVSGDPALLRAVLENLLGNAWKFTAKRERAELGLVLEQHEREPVVRVYDNGVGFDMTYAEKLFIPFARLHRQDEFQGTGVGLATVQRIIALHGGRIWAEAEVERGANFLFTLGEGALLEGATR